MLMIIRRKMNNVHLLEMKGAKKKKLAGAFTESGVLSFRERRCTFSLDFRSFGPSVLDSARSKVVLRGEGYAWTPIWWSYDNSKR